MKTRKEDSRTLDEKFRLRPGELNCMLQKLVAIYDPAAEKESPKDFHAVIKENKKFIICPMSKDAESGDNEAYLPNVLDMIKTFYAQRAERDCILLLPVFLCRGYLKCPTQVDPLKRKHAVLIEVDLQAKTIAVHDSQNDLRWSCYPDKLKEKLDKLNQATGETFQYDAKRDYHAYNRQDDSFSCGFYVYHYVRNILDTGNSRMCKVVRVDLTEEYTDKYDFFAQHKMKELVESHRFPRAPEDPELATLWVNMQLDSEESFPSLIPESQVKIHEPITFARFFQSADENLVDYTPDSTRRPGI